MTESSFPNTGMRQTTRPRVIVTSDFPPLDVIPVRGVKAGDPPERCSDPDDVQSMVRFLLCTNDLEAEALIASAGTFANIARKKNILDLLDCYEQSETALRSQDKRYPSAHELRLKTWQGMDGTIGTESFAGGSYKPIETLLGEALDTEASQAIIDIVDRPDPRPVWVCVWGGPRELAQAIWRVKHERSPEELKEFLKKLRVYLICKQDYTADWLLQNFPDLFIILSEKNYMGMFWNSDIAQKDLSDSLWVEKNIRSAHGALGRAYPPSGWDPAVPGVWEGDTPSFLHVLGSVFAVNNPEKPDQGGWGGRFIQPDPSKKHWIDHSEGQSTVSKWRRAVQEDFSRRLRWIEDT